VVCVCELLVVAGASGVSGSETWTISENDGRQASSVVIRWRVQRGWSPQGAQITLWTPQGSRWEGRHHTVLVILT